MFTARRNEHHQPGTWKPLRCADKLSASFTCPDCGSIGTLDEHEIKQGGVVSPSVACYDPTCSFHRELQLVGWPPLDMPDYDS